MSEYEVRVENKKTYNGDGFIIDRATPLGNPFRGIPRDISIDKYRDWLEDKLDDWNPTSQYFLQIYETCREEKSVVLICNCKPKRCHGDIIKEMIMETLEDG